MTDDLYPTDKKSRKYSKKKPAKKHNKLSIGILVVIFLIISYLSITFIQVYFSARTDSVNENTKVDAIVVLGAAQYNGTPSKVLQARLDHALDLFGKGVAPVIVVTGGSQPGDTTTEASASANYLLERGVKDEQILREVQGKSTYDSLRDTAAFAKENNIEKVVIVTDGYHEQRAKLIAAEVGLNAISSPAPNSPIKGQQEWENFFTETLRVSLGRIIGFRRVSRDSSLAGFVE